MRTLRESKSPFTGERTTEHTHKRGWPWLAAAVVFCPCHLPLTLGVLGGVLGGALTGGTGWVYLAFAGAFVFALWRGFSHVSQGDDCPACKLKR